MGETAVKHVWELDQFGEIEYFDQDGIHGGPRCTVCGEYFCQHEPDFDWDAEREGEDDRA